jgi:hypothetical protein
MAPIGILPLFEDVWYRELQETSKLDVVLRYNFMETIFGLVRIISLNLFPIERENSTVSVVNPRFSVIQIMLRMEEIVEPSIQIIDAGFNFFHLSKFTGRSIPSRYIALRKSASSASG